MTCPACGSSEIRTSRHARWSDIFQRVRGREAFRCRSCRIRFFASQSSESVLKQAIQSKHTHHPKKLMTSRAKKRLVKRLIVISIFAVALVLFLIFLRYLTKEPISPPESTSISSLSSRFLA
jgi:hypothetical protein